MQKRLGEVEFVALIAAIGGTTALGIDMILPAFDEIRSGLELDPGLNQVSLTVTAYFLGLAFGQLPYGPFADHFGRRPALFFGLTLYAGAALASALAPSFTVLVIARFIWGVGAAGPRALSLAVARDLYEGDKLARILSLGMAAFMVIPSIAPLLGEAVLAVADWRVVMGTPAVLALALLAWIGVRLPESLHPDAKRPLGLTSTRQAVRAVLSNRRALGMTASMMFDLASFAVFLGSGQLLFEEVYDRADSFAFWFGGMSLFMGVAVFLGSRLIERIGAERALVRLVIGAQAMAAVLLVVSLVGGGSPTFLLWFGLITVLNAARTLLTPVLNSLAMQEMGAQAGTAAAVIGTIALAGGSLLASIVDSQIDDSVTPLAIAYSGYGLLGLVCAFWGLRAQRPTPRTEPQHQ